MSGPSMWTRLSKRLDDFVPPDVPRGSEDASRARVATAIAFLMTLVFGALAVAHLVAGHLREALLNGGLALATAVAPFVMRRKGRYPLVLNLTIGLAMMTMAAVALERGPGINPATVALAEIPLFATLLGGVRVGAVWVVVSCAMSALVGLVGDTRFTRAAATDRLNDHVVLIVVTGTLVLVALLYERGKQRQLDHIAELEARRHSVQLERLRVNSESRIAQAERLASLGRVAAAVAHEVNNPLAYVLGNLEFVAERLAETSPPEIREALGDAIEGANRMKIIVADLQQFTRPAKASEDAGDVMAAVSSALKMAAAHLKSKAIVHTDLGNLPPVLGDTPRLTQVFLNLIVNAAQAMPEGKVRDNRVDIRARVEGERVLVEIEDTGEGMPPDVIERATDAFFTTKPTGQGLGLGLALSHTILEGARGKLEFESRPGRTVARVWLTPAPRAQRSIAPKGPVAEPAPPKDARLSVLIVDDEAALARALARVLKEQDVSVASSGREALELISGGKHFDLVLCDVMMPEVSGMDVYDTVARDHPAWLDRFVFMTGGIFTARMQEFQERIPNPFLSKPIESASLRALVDERRAKRD